MGYRLYVRSQNWRTGRLSIRITKYALGLRGISIEPQAHPLLTAYCTCQQKHAVFNKAANQNGQLLRLSCVGPGSLPRCLSGAYLLILASVFGADQASSKAEHAYNSRPVHHDPRDTVCFRACPVRVPDVRRQSIGAARERWTVTWSPEGMSLGAVGPSARGASRVDGGSLTATTTVILYPRYHHILRWPSRRILYAPRLS